MNFKSFAKDLCQTHGQILVEQNKINKLIKDKVKSNYKDSLRKTLNHSSQFGSYAYALAAINSIRYQYTNAQADSSSEEAMDLQHRIRGLDAAYEAIEELYNEEVEEYEEYQKAIAENAADDGMIDTNNPFVE